MKKPILILILLIFLASAACSLPVQTRWSVDPARTPAPVMPPSGRAMPEGVVNIMVLGSDFRPGGGARTDAIMLVSVNTDKKTVSVVSFPRDLYVPIPGWTTERLNTAFAHGGFDTLADTMEANFAVRPSGYVLTDFQGFKGIIDSLGGVEIYAGDRLVDRCDLPIAVDGQCAIEPGRHTMDGATALWYIRSRHTSSDLDRLRREQEVLMGIFIRLMSGGGLQDLPGLVAGYKNSVQTNLTVQALAPLLPTAASVFSDRGSSSDRDRSSGSIRRYALTANEAVPFVTDTGAQVLLPDYDAINAILDEAIFNP